MWTTQTILGKVQWFFNSGVGSFLQWWIWFMVMKRYTSLGSAMAISWYFNLIVGPFMALAASMQSIVSRMVPGERVYQVLRSPKEPLSEGVKVDAEDLRVGIRFDGVSFAYSDAKDVLRNVTLELPKGKVTALVGPSGSGKTTILNLICGLNSDYRGVITFGELARDRIALSSLRKGISLVPQNPFVFEDSILANLKYARQSASFDEVVHAAQMANIHKRILQFPEGYQTVIGPGKGVLSAGERQRMTLARAFLRNSPILILDEAFSNIDAESEIAIIKSLKSIREHKTVLIVTHRLSTVQFADRILVLSDGEIVESGSPAELLQSNGLLAEWIELQRLPS